MIAGILGAVLLRRRGPAVACAVLRAAQVGLVLCAIVAALPSPVRPITAITPPEVALEEEAPSQDIEAPAGQTILTESSFAPAESTATTAPAVKSLPWQSSALGVWAIGGLIGLGRLLIGHVMLRRLRRNSQLVDLGQVYPVELRESSAIPTPLLAGCVQSVLYLPQAGLLRESPEALQMILAHELAHHKRHDLAWSLSTQLLRALLWFHPLIHILANQQELLAEQASDEVALLQLPERQAYARLLLTLSELKTPTYSAPAMSMAPRKSRLGQRIRYLLSASLSRPLSARGRVGMALATLGVLTVGSGIIGYAQRPALSIDSSQSGRDFEMHVRRRVSLTVKNRPLKEVIAEISRQSLYPVTVDSSLSSSITLSVQEKDCSEVLKLVCAQIRPAAWLVPTRVSGTVGYAVLPLPAVGKFSGQVLTPAGKPLSGARVWCRTEPDGSGQAIPQVLRYEETTHTNTQGRFLLPRIGKWPYRIHVEPNPDSGLALKNMEVQGIPERTVTISPIQLTRGARIQLQFPNDGTYDALRPLAPALYRHQTSNDHTLELIVPAGEVRLTANKNIQSYKVRMHFGAGKPRIEDGILSLQLKQGELARLVIDAELTAEEKQKRLSERKAAEEKSSIRRRQMTPIQLAPEPGPFQDVVQKMCKLAGITELQIDPTIGGTVEPRRGGFLERMLQDVCAQATPVAYPLWEGNRLHIVRAPEPGKFDEKTRLYRLLGSPRAEVFFEAKGMYATGNSYHDAPGEEIAHVTVTYGRNGKPAAGITVVHETHGKVHKFVTDAQGRATLNFITGRNYYYILPPKGLQLYGRTFTGRWAESYIGFSLAPEADQFPRPGAQSLL